MKPVDAIVIGTSAGGIDALSIILPEMPACGRAPVFIVIHLPRERPSLAPQLLAAKCPMPVREAEDKLPIEPGTVYFAPPDYHLLIDQGPVLALSSDEPVKYSRPSIDVLFESAADVYGDRLMGIILTGASDDGTSGLQAVRGAGGTTVVQRPDTAVAALMAESALRGGPADFVLPLADIAALVRRVLTTDPIEAME